MASKKVTVKGIGPEMFGRGIDLLFGAADDLAQRQDTNGQPAVLAPAAQWSTHFIPQDAAVSPAREEAYLDVDGAAQSVAAPVPTAGDDDLLLAAEAFLSGQATPSTIGGPAGQAALPAEQHSLQAAASAPQGRPAEHEVSIPTAGPPPEQPSTVGQPFSDSATVEQPDLEAGPAKLAQQDHEGTMMPITIPDQPAAAAGAPPEDRPNEDALSRKVGVPSSNGKSGAEEAMLSAEIAAKEATALTRQEGKEILGKLRRSDLNALDREVDVLYDKVATLLSANRQEATIAFDILRRVRLILLKDPEQYADAEYLVNQVRARMNQIEQSLEGGRANAPRIFAYQTVWMVVFALLAMVTTVNGTTFSAWVAYLLGVSVNNEQLTWVVLFVSTLAWGGIGGVTSALWSLYHHISVDRDYNPVENLWYYSQPVLGMVLGGFVFLVFSAGFLVVQVDLGGQDAALGARLLPAAIAVVAGFRQNMVLDLVERIVALIVPSQQNPDSTLQAAVQQPIQHPPEELVI